MPKFTQFPAASSVALTDLVAITKDPSGTPITQKATIAQVSAVVSPWDSIIPKTSNQDVTNNATPQADTQLLFAVVTGGIYEVEFNLLYSGNDTTGDYRGRFAMNASSTAMGYYHHLNGTFVSTFVSQNVASFFPNTDMICGCDLLTSVRTAFMHFQLISAANENVVYQFANSVASTGRISRTAAGSLLRVKRLA